MMVVKYYVVFLFALCCMRGSAQRRITMAVLSDRSRLLYGCMDLSNYETIDTARMVVSYDFTSIQDVNTGLKRRDVLILQVGSRMTKCYGLRRYLQNQAYTRFLHEKKSDRIDLEFAGDGTVAYEIFLDKSRNMLLFFNEEPGWFSKRIGYEEELPTIEWRITGPCDSLSGYHCFSAEGRFSGRFWRVVFTPELPFNVGPWKLCGLPGLILQAEDTERQFRFESLEIKRVEEPIYMYDIQTDRTTKGKWQRLERAMYQMPYFFFSNGGKARISSGGEDLDETWTIPYNPIERE